ELAALWAKRKDLNRDGLPDNGPEQTFADGVREDLNMAGAHLVPALWQLRAYRDLAELGRAVGDRPAARRWRQWSSRTAHLIERTFWDEVGDRPVETIRPDGTPDSGPGFAAAVEPQDGLDPG